MSRTIKVALALALGLLLTVAAMAQGSTTISVDPPSQTVEAGDPVEVDVVVSTTQDVDFARVYLEWDPDYLAFDGVAGGAMMTETFRDVVTGAVNYKAVAPSPVSGTFPVATFSFTATAPVTETALALHPNRTKVKIDGAKLPSDKEDGIVVIEEPVPEPPLEPEALVFAYVNDDTLSPGETVWVIVWALDALNIASWEATLTYGGTMGPTGEYMLGGLFDYDEIPLGPDFGDGEIVAGQIAGREYTGNGRLVAYEFEALSPGVCAFRLPEAWLLRIDGTPQPLVASTGEDVTVTVETCLGDFAPDWGFRDLADIMVMLPAWNSDAGDEEYDEMFDVYPEGGDGHVGLGDVMAVVAVWNTPCP